jgi:hypothetical protein
MKCCQRQAKRKEKRYRKKKVHPISKYPPPSFTADEKIPCGGCTGLFDLGSNELRIHCNLCNKFFHCKIAGKCQGEACKIIKPDGTIHRSSYCYDCIGVISENEILCKDCFLDQHLEKAN